MKKVLLVLLIAFVGVLITTQTQLTKKFFVTSMVVFSRPIFPEASKILYHYCFGDGSELKLNSNYLKKSPVIQSELKKMKIGESKIIRFKQNKDWRLSYAINGFTMTKEKDKVVIKQYIKFDSSNDVYTDLNFIFFKYRIEDNIVHVFQCEPFWVYSEFNL